MHSAPSVTYPVGRSRSAAVLLALVWGAAAAVVLQWAALPGVSPARLGTGWLALAAAGVAAGWTWWAAAPGVLAWDGAGWTWTGSGAGAVIAGGRLEVGLDLQRVLLVRWRGPDAARWLWLERASCAERWDDLRRAVYSRARPEALPRNQPPAAKS
jgi:toxin CptA